MCDTYCVVHVLMGLAVGGDTRLRDECPVQCSRVRRHERPGSEPFSSSSTARPYWWCQRQASDCGPNSLPSYIPLGLGTAYTTAQVFILHGNQPLWPLKLRHPRVKDVGC